jgi:5-methylcytosine-specific restriction enzyme A
VTSKVEELGFEITDASASPTLRAVLEQAMAQLPQALGEPFTEHPLGRLLVREIPKALTEAVAEPSYKIQGSPGRGLWAETVWVSVFDRLVTTSAQNGYYLVYLLREDGAGVHLSLNQGTTAVHAEVGGRRYLSVLRDRAAVYAGLLGAPATTNLALGPIDLGAGSILTRGYEAGNIAAVHYP